MIVIERIKSGLCRLICPSTSCEPNTKLEARLDRAEKLHMIAGKAAAIENASVKARVGDMRITANSAVRRLRHERGEVGEAEA